MPSEIRAETVPREDDMTVVTDDTGCTCPHCATPAAGRFCALCKLDLHSLPAEATNPDVVRAQRAGAVRAAWPAGVWRAPKGARELASWPERAGAALIDIALLY